MCKTLPEHVIFFSFFFRFFVTYCISLRKLNRSIKSSHVKVRWVLSAEPSAMDYSHVISLIDVARHVSTVYYDVPQTDLAAPSLLHTELRFD